MFSVCFEMCRYYCHSILFLLSVSTIFAQNPQSNDNIKISTEIFSGTIFQELPLIPYESSIPILFALEIEKNLENITTFQNDRPCTQNSNSDTCKLEKDVQLILEHITSQIILENENWKTDLENNNLENQEKTRGKRGLDFIASALSWCCNLVSRNQLKGVIENQNGMIDTVNNMVDLTSQDNENLLLTSNYFNNFTSKVKNLTSTFNSSLNTLQKEINKLRQNPELTNQMYVTSLNTLRLLYLNFYFDNLRNLKENCLQNKMSQTVIPKKVLLQELVKLNGILDQYDQTIAINLKTHVDLLYKLPIAACHHNNTHILIRVQIPVAKSNKGYKTYLNIPIPLIWENKVCTVTKKHYKIITAKSQIFVLDSEHPNCDKESYPLCLLPRESILNDPDYHCIKHMLKENHIKILKTHCEFICNNVTDEPIITRLTPNKYLLTNIKKQFTLTCDQKNQSIIFPFKQTGTLELKTPCDCELTDQNGQIYLEKIHPCDKSDFKLAKVTHLLPQIWTKFDTLDIKSMSKDRHAFTDETELINNNWQFEITTLHLSDKFKVQKKIHLINSEKEIFDSHELYFYIIGIWLLILSLITLIAFYCIVINNAKIAILTPPNLPPR